MLCHLPLCSKISGESFSNGAPSIILESTVSIDNGLYCTPKGFTSTLNLLSSKTVPMLSAKQEPISISLLLCEISNVPQGNPTGVVKSIVSSNLYAKIINFIKICNIFATNLFFMTIFTAVILVTIVCLWYNCSCGCFAVVIEYWISNGKRDKISVACNHQHSGRLA